MDLWQRARVFAEETAKRSQEISISAAKRSHEFVSETAKRSQEISNSASQRSQEFVSETAKKSRDLAAEAIKTEALRRTDQIKSLAADIPIPIPQSLDTPSPPPPDLERFGITDELREFVKGISMSTFRDFPMEDEPVMEEVTTVSNVRQDLNEWQATHATLVLSAVKLSKYH